MVETRLFSHKSPGKLLPTLRDPTTGNEHAFLPNPLPPNWKFPEWLWPLLADAKQHLGLLEGIGRTLPNPAILLRPLADREAILSSRLEGTHVTATELLVYELNPQESQSEDDAVNRQKEVFNYRVALQQEANIELPLSLRLIRELHKTLMTGVRGRDHTPGQFRHVQVAIGTNHRFVPPPPEKLMECLDPLEKYFHFKNPTFDPLVDCSLIHYQFETIHPFNDGNGRVGRLLFALMLKEHCGLTKPWVYMSEYFETHREEYMQRLFDVSASGDWDGWVQFCLSGIVAQAKDAIRRCEQLQKTKERFMQELVNVGGSVRLNAIVEDLFQSPFIRIIDLQKKLNVTYPTAQKDVDRLVKAKILRALKNVTPKTYYSPEIFRAAYDKME
jgi:Fic family protein